MKRIVCFFLIGIITLLACGCAKEPKPVKEETTLITKAILETDTVVLAGEADLNGYYSIDIPRSFEDTKVLSEINNRLYFVSANMCQNNIKEFDVAPVQLVWDTILMEISFNYGSGKPFSENSVGSGASVAKDDLTAFITSCFNVNISEYSKSMPLEFKDQGANVEINYRDLETTASGFVMSNYKQDGNNWFVKGDIIGENNTIYATGEFHLEYHTSGMPVAYRIVSFKSE